MNDVPEHTRVRPRRAMGVAPGVCALFVPQLGAVSSPAAPPAIALYTAAAVAVVVGLAALAAIAVNIARRLGIITKSRHVRLRSRFRVVFGATFLLATVTPYAALNFSASGLAMFVVCAGLIVAAWVWGASRRRDAETGISAEGH